jgi:RNA polymerase sigma-70 factor (ECF subfamily)
MSEFMLKQSEGSTLSEAIRLAGQGDSEAFAVIYRSYSKLVYRICLRMLRDAAEAEDATQDVFVLLFLKINTFRGESAFSSWLYRLTTNAVLMRFRRNKRFWMLLGNRMQDYTDPNYALDVPDLQAGNLFGRIDLQAAIDVLPYGYKAAFILHDVHGYQHKEIAVFLGCSVGNSKSQLHKARMRLRTLLADVRGERHLGGEAKSSLHELNRLRPRAHLICGASYFGSGMMATFDPQLRQGTS